MYKFGNRSRKNLNTCHKDIQTILEEVIKFYDFSVIEGYRTIERQQELYNQGRSHIDGVTRKGNHNYNPSMAVDIIPYKKYTNPFSGKEKDNRRFYFMMGLVRATAERLLIEGKIDHLVRFGLDWDGDDIYTDQNFDDLPHFELIKP